MLTPFTRLWHRNELDITSASEALRGVRGSGVPTFRESLPRLGLELRRARRYERSVAALAIAPELRARVRSNGGGPEPVIPSIHDAAVSTYLTFFVFGSLLRETLRETDVLAYAPEQQYYAVLLPESSEADARGAVTRITQIVKERMEIGLRAGVSEFPRHGLTVEDLFAEARREWEGRRWVGPIPVLKELSNG